MSQPLRLEPATLDDVPVLSEIWYAAFTDPAMRHIWPDTPGMRQWWDEANRTDMLQKPFQKYLKVVDLGRKDAQGRLRVVAYAKWDLAMPEERGRRFPPWHVDQSAQDNEAFLASLESSRRRVMGEHRHYYLDMLCTHPDYQRRGAAGMLIKWGCDRADADGVGVYIDASVFGKPLYEKFGFVDYSLPGDGDLAPMGRKKL